MAINQVVISGNLTRDAEMRTSQNGANVLKFGVAVNDRVKRGDVWTDYANFIDCTMFGKRAESIVSYLKKGTKVCVNGRLHYTSWQDRNNQNHSKIEVVVNDIEFMSKAQNQANNEPVQQSTQGAYANEDIPF